MPTNLPDPACSVVFVNKKYAKQLARLATRLMDALLPRHCLMCGLPSGPGNLCQPCRADLPRSDAACRQCALPLPANPGLLCGACLARSPPWDHAVSALLYRFPVDRLVCRFKFNRNLACGAALAGELTLAVEEQCKELPDLLVPVPLHRTRHFLRGFNQAELLARTVGRKIGLPVDDRLLQRCRRTSAQSGLDARNRLRNTRGAFRAKPRRRQLLPRHVALVDDVMTTGATLHACSRELKRAGVQAVSVWVAARAPDP